MKKFAIAIVALLIFAFAADACNNVRVASCNSAAVIQSSAVVVQPQVVTAFVPVTTLISVPQIVTQQVVVPQVQTCSSFQTQVFQQSAFSTFSAFSVQPFVAAAVVSPFVNVNVNVRQKGRLFGNRQVIRQRQVIRGR